MEHRNKDLQKKEHSEKSTLRLDKLTAPVEEGPYYKRNSPERTSIVEEGVPGERIILTGMVLDLNGRPIDHAWIDFWQANGNGEYDNSGFVLRGHQYTDKSGKYLLETVVPGGYAVRTPHIHAKVRANDISQILTTQLFIPGVPTNKTDRLYRQDLEISITSGPQGKKATFDFVVGD